MIKTSGGDTAAKSARPVFNKIKKLLLSALFGVAVTVVLLCICAVVLAVSPIPDSAVTVFAYIAVALGAIASGFVSAKLFRTSGMLNGAVAGFVFFLLHLAASLIFGGGFSVATAIFLGLDAIAGAVGGIAGMNIRR